MGFGGIIIDMVTLYLGALLANVLLMALPILSGGGWLSIIFVALIQAILICIYGLASGTATLWRILILTIVIVLGSIVGSFVAEFISLSGIFATVVVLAIQTLVLTVLGLLKGSKPAVSV